ncbi:MAG: helix-turn-helix domain-containing protein, partial [Planctomycetota bacterium]|nr:helix-turn-helix domain-containing protein [Planctomycetota bacterium]
MARRKKIAKKKSDSRQSAVSNNRQDTKSPGGESSDLLDMAQAIEMLKTTRNTFYRWLRSGRIKGFKVGRQWRFYRKDLDNFLKGDGPRIDLPTDITPLIESLLAHIRKLGARDISNPDSEPALRAVHLM